MVYLAGPTLHRERVSLLQRLVLAFHCFLGPKTRGFLSLGLFGSRVVLWAVEGLVKGRETILEVLRLFYG